MTTPQPASGTRFIRWTASDGTRHLLDTIPLGFGFPERIYPHPFEAEVRRYMIGPEIVTRVGACWCGADEAHPIHAEPVR